MIFNNMNQYVEYFHENWLPKVKKKFKHMISLKFYFNLLNTFLNGMLIILKGYRKESIYLSWTDVALKLICFCFKVKLNLLKKQFCQCRRKILKEMIFR